MAGYNILPHIDLYSEDCANINFAQIYIDVDLTEAANSTNDFRSSNMYVTDADMSMDNLKVFRTWLAKELLAMNTDENGNYLNLYNDEQIHMLEYYKNNMYNEVVKFLDKFGNSSAYVEYNNGCSCCSNNTPNNMVFVDSCDAISIYRKNIHSFMNTTFSNVDFWSSCNKTFLHLFKKYIDNIITSKLVINNDYSTSFGVNIIATCNCDDSKNNISFIRSMENLSKSLEFIINDDIVGHKNFIYDALDNWSKYLYEKMYWK